MSRQDQEEPNGKPAKRGKKVPKGDYEVGYCRPPVHTRFPPGVSGYPKGRPVGRPNNKTAVARVINETVSVREGDKIRTISKLEAILQAHTMKAIKGDPRSASIVIGVVKGMGLLGETEADALEKLSQEDDEILADYMRRHSTKAAPDDDAEKQ